MTKDGKFLLIRADSSQKGLEGMDKLENFILQIGLVSPKQLRDAQFNFPQSGLIEALAYEFGPEKQRFVIVRLCETLNISFLEDHEITIEDEIFRFDIDRMVLKHRAVPLSFDASSGICRLAMTNPFNEEAKAAFADAFSSSIEVVLAPESALISAWSKNKARFNLSPQAPRRKVPSDGGDPEALKAVQQVMATAVKHGIEQVNIDLSLGFTRAHFQLQDSASTSIDISVSPSLFLSSLFSQSVVTDRRSDHRAGVLQVCFKALRAECCFQYADMLQLKHFVVDSHENLIFWRGMKPEVASALRTMCRSEAGVFFVVSRDEKSRIHAMTSLRDYYSGSETLEMSLAEALRQSTLNKGRHRRVFVGIAGEDVFEVLEACSRLSRSSKEMVGGVFSYQQLEQNCWSCEQTDNLEEGALSCIPHFIDLTHSRFRKGGGCEVCGGSGSLGWVGAASVANLRSKVGAGFISGNSYERTIAALVGAHFKTLFEDAVGFAAEGAVRLHTVLNTVARPPSSFETNFWRRPRGAHIEHELVLDEGQLPVNGSFERSLKQPEEPLRGSDAFYGKRNVEVSVKAQETQAREELVAREDAQLLLIIDDDPDQREILQRVLELEGYRVVVASDGIDGIVCANRQKPDLIIVDFMMPDLDGRETVLRLKQNASLDEVPIVVLTAYPDSEVEFSLLEAGADDFLSKATAKKVLLKRISRLL